MWFSRARLPTSLCNTELPSPRRLADTSKVNVAPQAAKFAAYNALTGPPVTLGSNRCRPT